MKTIQVRCSYCQSTVQKDKGEVTRSRKIGRLFFCDISCAAKHSNLRKKSKPVPKVCPTCRKRFVSSTRRRAPRFCSRSCASAGSMNEDRREAQRQGGLLRRDNLISPAETLKRREAWKYVLMEKILNEAGIKHEFEYEMGPFVFDLAILDKKILVEFDGKSHQTRAQRELDIQKDKMANKKGFIVVRRETPEMAVVDPIVLEGLL